jgi:cytohesin
MDRKRKASSAGIFGNATKAKKSAANRNINNNKKLRALSMAARQMAIHPISARGSVLPKFSAAARLYQGLPVEYRKLLNRYPDAGNAETRKRHFMANMRKKEEHMIGIARRLLEAVRRGNVKGLKSLLDETSWPGASNGKTTLLHEAIELKHVDMVRLLLDRGADPNATDKDGHTPMHFAIWRVSPVIVDMLLRAGADPNMRSGHGRTSRDGRTALQDATARIDHLYRNGAPRGENLSVVLLNCRKIVKSILSNRNVNVNLPWTDRAETESVSPLYEAVRDPHTVKQLLMRGADPNGASTDILRNDISETALIRAVSGAEIDTVKLLLASPKLKLDTVNYRGSTALHKAIDGNSKEITKLLIARGANVNARDGNGKTPLHHAIRQYSIDIIKMLLEKGASIDKTVYNQMRDTYLMYNDPELVNLLSLYKYNRNKTSYM